MEAIPIKPKSKKGECVRLGKTVKAKFVVSKDTTNPSKTYGVTVSQSM